MSQQDGQGMQNMKSMLDSLGKTFQSLGDWGLGDFMLLFKLAQKHEQIVSEMENINLAGTEETNRDVMFQLLEDCEIAFGSYVGSDVHKIADMTNLKYHEVLHIKDQASVNFPAYYIARDTPHKKILLVIRGTMQMEDIATDLTGHCDGLYDVISHQGIKQSALIMMDKCMPTVKFFLEQNRHKGYGFKIIGHSLGGGTGIIMTQFLKKVDKFKGMIDCPTIECVAYGCPPCLIPEACEECKSYVTSVQSPYDVVPRISLPNVQRLLQEVRILGFEEEYKKQQELNRKIEKNEAKRQILTFKFTYGDQDTSGRSCYLKSIFSNNKKDPQSENKQSDKQEKNENDKDDNNDEDKDNKNDKDEGQDENENSKGESVDKKKQEQEEEEALQQKNKQMDIENENEIKYYTETQISGEKIFIGRVETKYLKPYIHVHLKFKENQLCRFEQQWAKRNLQTKEEFIQSLVEKSQKEKEEKEQKEQACEHKKEMRDKTKRQLYEYKSLDEDYFDKEDKQEQNDQGKNNQGKPLKNGPFGIFRRLFGRKKQQPKESQSKDNQNDNGEEKDEKEEKEGKEENGEKEGKEENGEKEGKVENGKKEGQEDNLIGQAAQGTQKIGQKVNEDFNKTKEYLEEEKNKRVEKFKQEKQNFEESLKGNDEGKGYTPQEDPKIGSQLNKQKLQQFKEDKEMRQNRKDAHEKFAEEKQQNKSKEKGNKGKESKEQESKEGENGAEGSENASQYDEEKEKDQAELPPDLELCQPGTVYHIQRFKDQHGFEREKLIKSAENLQTPLRIILLKSSLEDHFLPPYMKGLKNCLKYMDAELDTDQRRMALNNTVSAMEQG